MKTPPKEQRTKSYFPLDFDLRTVTTTAAIVTPIPIRAKFMRKPRANDNQSMFVLLSTYIRHSASVVNYILGGGVGEQGSRNNKRKSNVAYKEVIQLPSSKVDTRLARADVAPVAATAVSLL